MWILVALSLCGLAPGQSGPQAPGCGYVFDSVAGAIRPIRGFPGAATAGMAVGVPFAVRVAAIASEANAAVVISGGENAGVYWLRQMNGPVAVSQRLADSANDRDAVALNPAGTAALLYLAGPDLLQFWDLTGTEARMNYELRASTIPGEFLSAAVSPLGTCALVGTAGRLQQVCAQDAVRPLFAVDGLIPGALTYLPGGEGALFADRAANRIYMLSSLSGLVEPVLAASADNGVLDPVRIVIPDRTAAIVTNAGDASLVRLSLKSAEGPATIALPAPVADLEFVASSSVLVGRIPGWASFLLIDLQRDSTPFLVPPPVLPGPPGFSMGVQDR